MQFVDAQEATALAHDLFDDAKVAAGDPRDGVGGVGAWDGVEGEAEIAASSAQGRLGWLGGPRPTLVGEPDPQLGVDRDEQPSGFAAGSFFGRRSGPPSRQHDLSDLKYTGETPRNGLGPTGGCNPYARFLRSADASAASHAAAAAHSATAPDTATASNAAATCDQFWHWLGHDGSPSSWLNPR